LTKLPSFLDSVVSPTLAAIVIMLLFLQWRFPLRRQHFAVLRRLVRNYAVSLPGFVIVRFALLPIPFAIAAWAESRQVGLMNWLRVPEWIAAIAGFVLLDYTYWWWHRANHIIPFFWRFHNVHHTDLDMDVTTAARFHFGEIFFSIAFLSLVVLVFGISPVTFIAFFVVFEGAVSFHHSNWRLPIELERILNRIVVTPRMHGIHHSIVERETNSNWGTIFCWWDRLHRTLRRDVAQDEITIGVAAYRDERELTFAKLWALPFRRQRKWRMPDGTVPVREPREARELMP
jgi:sterol desaturase/sphingolipid hydroxylase (fatty acid hydroxylase superfamily)